MEEKLDRCKQTGVDEWYQGGDGESPPLSKVCLNVDLNKLGAKLTSHIIDIIINSDVMTHFFERDICYYLLALPVIQPLYFLKTILEINLRYSNQRE